jgi:hypothetical protein
VAVMAFLSAHNQRHPELVSGSIRMFFLPNRRQTQPNRKINPMWILIIDKIYFPRPVPIFQLLLARNGTVHVAKHFEMNKVVYAIFRGKTIRMLIAMLMHTLHQIRRNTYVKRAVMFAGQNIDARLFFFSHRSVNAAKWTLKQVQGDGILKNKRYYHNQRHLQNPRHPELVSGSIGRLVQFKMGAIGSQDGFFGGLQ